MDSVLPQAEVASSERIEAVGLVEVGTTVAAVATVAVVAVAAVAVAVAVVNTPAAYVAVVVGEAQRVVVGGYVVGG